jgi:hypothetical protein
MLAPFAVPGGAVGLLGAVAWMVFTGRLVPGRTHERMLADKDKQIEDWRTAHAAEVERGEVLAAQVSKLLTQGDITVGIVQALPRAKDSAS